MKCAITTARQSFDIHGQMISQFEEAYGSYLLRYGYQLYILPAKSDLKAIDMIQPQLVLLPGGGDIPAHYYDSAVEVASQTDRDVLETYLIEYSISNKIPLLGICRGMQMINGFLGGKVTRATFDKHPIGINHLISHIKSGREYEVNSYHRDIINPCSLSKSLKAIAIDCNRKHIEAFTGMDYHILGLQWHPERLVKMDTSKDISHELLLNFFTKGE